MYNLIDGKNISLDIKNEIKINVEDFTNKFNRKITLAVIMVGENPASKVYVNNKIKACEVVGIKSLSYHLPEDSSQEDVESLVNSLSNDNCVDGILVQLPLPKHLNEQKILEKICPEKDVDGFLAENVGNLVINKPATIACTPYGVIQMLKRSNIELSGKNAVVLGRSNIVGKPMAMLLLQENCTVTVCHSKTKDLSFYTKNADIIVAAIGKPKFLKGDMVKEGVVVIDVGINKTTEGLVGDVDFEEVSKKASYISPVPGGVGPMTIAMLMYNTYYCALRRESK